MIVLSAALIGDIGTQIYRPMIGEMSGTFYETFSFWLIYVLFGCYDYYLVVEYHEIKTELNSYFKFIKLY